MLALVTNVRLRLRLKVGCSAPPIGALLVFRQTAHCAIPLTQR